MTTALLVVDMQNGFCHRSGSIPTLVGPLVDNDRVVRRNVEAVDRARVLNMPVIFTRHCWDKSMIDAGLSFTDPIVEADRELARQLRDFGALIQGSRDADVIDDLSPIDGEFVIDKPRYDAFLGTRLEQILRGLRVDELMVTGVVTNVCVESTTRSGYMRDYRMTVISDCVTAQTRELHDNALMAMESGRFARVAPLDDIVEMQLAAAA